MDDPASLFRVGLVATRKEGSTTRSVLDTPEGAESVLALATDAPLSEADRLALDRVRAARVDPTPERTRPGRRWEKEEEWQRMLAEAPAPRQAWPGSRYGEPPLVH